MTRCEATAGDILRDAAIDGPDGLEVVRGFDTQTDADRVNAIRFGDHILTMDRGEHLGGDATDGYGYTFGTLEPGGEYLDASDAQWADDEAAARDAVARWVATVTR